MSAYRWSQPPPRLCAAVVLLLLGGVGTRIRSAELSVEDLVAKTRPAVVTLTHLGRDGNEGGMGTGFVISSNGLIATCLHVIGEARPIRVRFSDGQQRDVKAIHAWDRKLDLAILEVEAEEPLKFLELGDSEELKQGATVVAIGNPMGLERSVVSGVVSARRDFGEGEMIQLAIPIEPGNSGGPMLDLRGRVQGILNMKSAMTANLGFAIPVNWLKPLVANPNPVPLERWLNLGSLDPKRWSILFGGRWTQKAGRIEAERPGTGFGGRSLCLWQEEVPETPYEIGVAVKLDDESGAAGLAFLADGGDRHYGFYPSAERLRLTRFEGPSVYSWTVLKEVPSPHYRPGEWNHLKVRVEAERILCFVNGELVIESDAPHFQTGKAGLAKFRQTRAQFRQFEVGNKLADPAQVPAPPQSLQTGLKESGEKSDRELLAAFGAYPEWSRSAFRDRAAELEEEAERLRRIADRIHRETVQRELLALMEKPEAEMDLFHGTLLISKLDNPEVDIEAYRRFLDEMGRELAERLPPDPDEKTALDVLRRFLFEEQGFHGSRGDYYNRANSWMDRVIDDREGLPITLSVLFLELGRRIRLETLDGIALPGHFVVRHSPAEGEARLIDVFDSGKVLSPAEAAILITSATGELLRETELERATKREILIRILRNLRNAAGRSGTMAESLPYLDMLVALSPENFADRLNRAMIRLQTGDKAGAKEDLKWLLDKQPPALDLDRVEELYRSL